MKLNRHSMHASELTGYVYLFKSLSQPKLFGYLQQPQRGHPTPCLLDCIVLMFHLFCLMPSVQASLCTNYTPTSINCELQIVILTSVVSSPMLFIPYPKPCCLNNTYVIFNRQVVLVLYLHSMSTTRSFPSLFSPKNARVLMGQMTNLV
jgi:hypothetical protein